MRSISRRNRERPAPLHAERGLCLHDLFERQVDRAPDRIAIQFGNDAITYGDLDRAANQLARYLRRTGVKHGDLVGLYFRRTPMLYTALLACLKAGAGYVPIQPGIPRDRVQHIAADSGMAALLSEEFHADFAAEVFDRPAVLLDRDSNLIGEESSDRLDERVRPGPSDPCYVIYTSGSTGKPKGVLLEHKNVVRFVLSANEVYGVREEDRVYHGFSVAFDAAVEEVWSAFSNGATLYVATEDILRSPVEAAAFVKANAITFFSTVPSFLAMIEEDLPSVRILIVGGEACPPELVDRWARAPRRMLNTYGPTEAAVVATWSECTPGMPVTIGKPLPGYHTVVLTEKLERAAVGEVGELYIGGDCVARGYVNLLELTTERFIPNPFPELAEVAPRLYRTADLVKLNEEGDLLFLGRADGQVKVRGFRIELSEIESVLLRYGSVRAAAVAAVRQSDGLNLAAYVVLDTGGSLDRRDLAAHLNAHLPEYMIPKYLDLIEELPRMTSGKVDRNALPVPVSLLREGSASVVEPATEAEAEIQALWQEVLGIEPISVEDDFFSDLGGHSLVAAKATTVLREQERYADLSVQDIYRCRTIRSLAAEFETRTNPIPTMPPAVQEETTLSRARYACVALQAIAIYLLYALASLPFLLATFLVTGVRQGAISLDDATRVAVVASFAAWPALLALSICTKWLVIGRYRPGVYRIWSFYYFRWWLVARVQGLSMYSVLAGTPLMSLYYRLMGARVGANTVIGTPFCSAFDLVSIGERSSVGAETHILGYRLEGELLVIGRVTIGDDCFVGTQSNLGLDVRMADGARLDDMSALSDGSFVPAGEGRRGSPAEPAEVTVPLGEAYARNPVLYGLLHLALIYAMGYFLIAAALPEVLLVAYTLLNYGVGLGIASAFAAVPLSVFTFCVLLVIAKRLIIGRIAPGLYSLHGTGYLRIWMSDYLLSNLRTYFAPIYATLYFPPLLRLLGAQVGRRVEISTVSHVIPDLLEMGDESFFADGCIVGGKRIFNGYAEVLPNRIGTRTFIGNSAFVPGGVDIGNEALLGVLSTPPAPMQAIPDGTRWLGAPSFPLPQTEKGTCFAEATTYRPPRRMVIERYAIDAVRILLPGFITTLALVGFVSFLFWGYSALPRSWFFALTPAAMLASTLGALLLVVLVKKLLIGTFQPSVHPLWSRHVWFNEVVNAVHETVGAGSVAVLLGTPFLAFYLRSLGCRIGRWVCLETTLFSEFDLVTIGDRASLNLGATIQTHLFEDRVMKSAHLEVGDGCTVGNMAVVLYGTTMGRGSNLAPLSLLMKGESVPAATSWQGIPIRKTAARHYALLPPPGTSGAHTCALQGAPI